MKTFFWGIAILLLAHSAQAWNVVGHRAVALMAWRNLNQGEKREVSELLKHHPHYREMLAASVPVGVQTNEWVFLNAAVWPDWVRSSKPGQPSRDESITKYDLYPHAIGYPFVRERDREFVSTNDFFIAKPNAEMVLADSIATIRNRQASAHDRAVSLCWTLHLFGDLHQPLHAATWVRKDRVEWDGLGGNYFVFDPSENPPRKIHLHSFWDNLGGTEPTHKGTASLADSLKRDERLKASVKREYRENKSIASWVQESYRLAVHYAYAEERVQFAHIDDLKSGKISEKEIPFLHRDYIQGAREIARRRLFLANMRLSDVLEKAF